MATTPDPEAIGRRLAVITAVAALVFATAAYLLVS
mgnify:CR=1 FL=1|jgi:hypothetical protein